MLKYKTAAPPKSFARYTTLKCDGVKIQFILYEQILYIEINFISFLEIALEI